MKNNFFLILHQLLICLFVCFLSKTSLLLATISVSNTVDLQNAIITANSTPDTILFTDNITLTGPLPAITAFYTINGDAHFLDGAFTYRGFLSLTGSANPTFVGLIIQNTLALGGNGGNATRRRGGSGGGGLGAGGGIYVGNGSVAIVNTTTFSNCAAQGGDAPTPVGTIIESSAGGGGGGLGGNGGLSTGDLINGGGNEIKGYI